MRIERRKWPDSDFGILSSGGILDAFDNAIKSFYRITDDEYDLMAEKMSDDEMDIFLTEKMSFTHGRSIINLLNKYLENS